MSEHEGANADRVTVRSWRPGDEPAIIELVVGIQRDEFSVPITAADQPDLTQLGSFYQGFWIAVDGDRLVGTIGLLDRGEFGVVRKMFVHADHRGRRHRIGERLLATLLAEARRRALATVYLGTIERFAAARRFYVKHGFVEIDRAELPPDFPRMAVDDRFYRLALPATRTPAATTA